MANNYSALAPVYDRTGMAQFTRHITGIIHDYAQSHEWMGRRVLDVGCGTGAVMEWFRQNRPRLQLIGVDRDPAMLEQVSLKGIGADTQQKDIRDLSGVRDIDLALAMNVMNEMDSIRDLEAAFRSIHTTLSDGKLFVFDLHTTEGLADDSGDSLITNDPDLAVFVHKRYDYERQALTCDYVLFQQDNNNWAREEAHRIVRAYPVQAVGTLLRRTGFEITALMNERLNPLTTVKPGTQRVLFFATKN